MIDERLGVLVVLAQPLLDHVGVSSSRPRASRRCSTTSSRDVEEDDGVEVQALGLRERAREAVEHVAVAGLEDRADGLA